MGSGYLKCGIKKHSKPVIIPAAFKARKTRSSKSILHELDPARTNWEFPLESGMIPSDTTTLARLCELALNKFPQLIANKPKLEFMLLLFPLVEAKETTALCKELQEVLGSLHVEAAIQQVLTWGYWGRKTGLIVDIGYSISFVTPIYRGFLLEEQIIPVITGSFFISAALRRSLLRMAEKVPENKAKNYIQMAEASEVINDIKQSLCRVYPYSYSEDMKPELEMFHRYQEQKISLGTIPWDATEVLFQPTILGVGDKGLFGAIIDVLNSVDPTVRAELASNIVLSGGGAMIPGIRDRLENDLKERIPHLPVKVYDLEHPLYSAWLGATRM